MHVDEVDIDESLVRRLLTGQLPQWKDLPLEPVSSAGTDNALFRLADDKVVRLPRIQGVTGQVDKEHRWLPRLAPHLPLAIPIPLAKCSPSEDYPWHWSIYRWLEGENAAVERINDPRQAAIGLAHFVADLQRIDPEGGPPPGEHNFFRGVPLAMRDAETRESIDTLRGILNWDEVSEAWDEALQCPEWRDPAVWVHGDLSPGNLLIVDGTLSGVIDFGGLAVGDPACDLIVAWNLLSADTREVFRAALGADDATWARGRGWALSVALIQLPYYKETNPQVAASAQHVIHEVLADRAVHQP
jgi:aminoglycoside phosphotransferase (APT) family kinase protein